MAWFLLLTLPLAAWLLYWLPERAAQMDYKAIEANGSADTLKKWFHFWRAFWRGAWIALVSVMSAVPLYHHPLAWQLLTLATGIPGLGWFFYRFNPRLSQLRGKNPYYVSFAPDAAYFPDRYLVMKAYAAYPTYDGPGGNDEHAQELRAHMAGQMLQRLLLRVLRACEIAYAVLILATALLVHFNP